MNSNQLVAINADSLHKSVIMMSCYRTPRPTSFESLFDEIQRLSNKYRYNPVWIGGDLIGLPDIDWETKSIIGSQYPKALNGSLLEILDLCNSDQLDNFTSRKNHTLDLVITNRPSFVEKCLPIPGFGDHDTAISVDAACQLKYSKPPRWEVFMWKKVDFESLKSDIRNIMTMFIITNSIETPIDDLWTKFSKHIIDIEKRHVPSIMTSPRFSQPWITRECKRKISRKKRAYKKFKRTKLDSDWLKYQEAAKKSRKPCKKCI